MKGLSNICILFESTKALVPTDLGWEVGKISSPKISSVGWTFVKLIRPLRAAVKRHLIQLNGSMNAFDSELEQLLVMAAGDSNSTNLA